MELNNNDIMVMHLLELKIDYFVTTLNVITTCFPIDIKAFKAEVVSNLEMAYPVMPDCLSLTEVNRFTDKMELLLCNVSTMFYGKIAFSKKLQVNCIGLKTGFEKNLTVQDKRHNPNSTYFNYEMN